MVRGENMGGHCRGTGMLNMNQGLTCRGIESFHEAFVKVNHGNSS
jgi:hypothetical protein